MEIVLSEDMKALGKKGQVAEVSEGYARNFTPPKKLGVEATPKNLSGLKLQKANTNKIAAEQLAAAREPGGKLEKSPVTLSIKAGKNGRAFDSASSREISKAITEQLELDIDKKKLVLLEPLRVLGTHEALVKLHKDVTAKLTAKVIEAWKA